MTREDLERVREWTIRKIVSGNEPPWSWYQHMKLREALDAILAGMAATQPMEDSLGLAPRRSNDLRVVGGADRQDNVPYRSDAPPVPLPM
jgi:hypothetical protein